MSYTFFVIALIAAAVDWLAVARGWKKLEMFAKPAVMIALLVWLWQVSGLAGPVVWFGIGLLFSLAGDIFLMLPRERFIAGLVSFLIAHLTYLVGFNVSLPPVNAVSLILAVMVGIMGRQIYNRIAEGLLVSGKPKYRIPLGVYAAAISLMLVSALITLGRAEWAAGPALLASAGALLFYISDTFLAWNKFVAPLPHGRLRVHVTYHLGQALLILGVALHFLPG